MKPDPQSPSADQEHRKPPPQPRRAAKAGASAIQNPILGLQRSIGNQGVISLLNSGVVQAKLRVSQPGDADEQEADRVAREIVSSPDGHAAAASSASATLHRKCNCTGGDTCPECETEDVEKAKGVHRKSASNSVDRANVPDDLLRDLGPGNVIDPAVRENMESRFDHDFSDVRIHDDARAAQSARSVNARAFTLGRDVVFDAGEYSPQTPSGKTLLSHELAHVVQQASSTPNSKIHRQPKDTDPHAGQEHSSQGLISLAGVPSEKWSEQIEGQYRMRGDTDRANAIRACRMQGRSACAKILTATETMRLLALAKESRGDQKKIEMGLSGAAPLLARSAPFMPGPPLQLVPSPPPVAPIAALAPETVVAVGGAAAIVAICVVAGLQLWELSKFQDELRAKGFVIIDDPLALCVGGCHLPARRFDPPALPSLPNVPPQLMLPNKKDLDVIEKYLEQPKQGPKPAAQPKKDQQKECLEAHKFALVCGPEIDEYEAVRDFLFREGVSFADILDIHCKKMGDSFPEGKIGACNYAPGESWHCSVKTKNGTRVVSIFRCLCCAEDGSTSYEWRGAHWSSGR